MLLNGKLTGLWEPELLHVGRGSNTYSCKNMIINVYNLFDDVFVIFLSLNVKLYL